MPMIKDQEILYTLLSEGRLDLMCLPAGAIAWLWKDERPEEQIIAATKMAIAAKDINPIVNASVLKADKNILILKCEDGQTFRIYPGGGYSRGGEEMLDLNGFIEAMQSIPAGEMQEPEADMPCDDPEAEMSVIAVSEVPEDGFDHMTAPQPPEEAMFGGPMNLEDLLRRADGIDEEYGDQPRAGQYYTYDELASEASRDIQAHSGEDTEEYDTTDKDCSMGIEGQVACPDGGLPSGGTSRYDSKKEYSQGNGDELGESFNFSDLKKKSKITHNHFPSYIYEDTDIGSLASFNPTSDGGFWVNGFTNKAVTHPGASHAEMIRQHPDAFDVTPDGMPLGDLKDIWQSDEYEAWLDTQDDNRSDLKLGVFGTGWVRGSADDNEFVGFTGTLSALKRVKKFVMRTINNYHPDEVYIDIISGNNMNTLKLNMRDITDLKKLIGLFGGKAPATTENAGGAAAASAPLGTDMFDTEDDIASGVIMQFEDEN